MAKSKKNEWLDEDKLTLLKGWARDGLTDEQIAKNMKISRSTLSEWKKKYPDISDTLKKEKEIVDYEVENALLKKALGYTKRLEKQKVTNAGEIVDYYEEVHIAPDSTALIFWLKNRKPKQWRDKISNDDEDKDIQNAQQFVAKIKEVASNYEHNRNK